MGHAMLMGPTPSALWDFRLAVPGGVTFSRPAVDTVASHFDAAGVMRRAAADIPRLDHDPVTLAPLGLLLEPAATNKVTQSSALDSGAWVKVGVSVTPSATIAPDGTTTACRLSAIATDCAVYHHMLVPAGQAVVFSIFLRADAATTLSLLLIGVDPIPATVCTVGTGWTRHWVSGIPSAGWVVPHVGGAESLSAPESVYAACAQLESGTVPTSPIATTGTAASRAEDVASITLARHSDLLVQDAAGGEWRDGIAAGPHALTPRSGRHHVGRVMAFPAGLLAQHQKLALGGAL